MSLSPIPDLIAVGERLQLTVRVLDQNGIEIRDVSPSWSSSDTLVATVDQEGEVYVAATGKAVIKVTYEGLSADDELVTLPAIAGRVVVDGEPLSGLAVRASPHVRLGVAEDTTDEAGSFQFINRRAGDNEIAIFGEDLGYDILLYGFQANNRRVELESGTVAAVEFNGYSIPECETHPLIRLEFVNNDPVFDDYWRSAVCRWINIVTDVYFEDCVLRTYDGVIVRVEYVDSHEAERGEVRFCNGSPLDADFKFPQSNLFDPDHWLVPPQMYRSASRYVAHALGIFSIEVPGINERVSGSTGEFMGAEASSEFQALGGVGSPNVRVAEDGWVRWSGDELCNEAFALGSKARTSQPISAVTVAALEDTGAYEVNRDAAEPFFPYDCSAGDPDAAVAPPTPTLVNHLRIPYR